jgi:hypothetical protein
VGCPCTAIMMQPGVGCPGEQLLFQRRTPLSWRADPDPDPDPGGHEVQADPCAKDRVPSICHRPRTTACRPPMGGAPGGPTLTASTFALVRLRYRDVLQRLRGALLVAVVAEDTSLAQVAAERGEHSSFALPPFSGACSGAARQSGVDCAAVRGAAGERRAASGACAVLARPA